MARSNRLWAGTLLTLSLVLIVLSAGLSPPPQDPGPRLPSSLQRHSQGALAAYRILGELFETVERNHQPPVLLERMSEDGPISTLLVMGPSRPLSEPNAQALDEWVAQGGNLIVASSRPWRIELAGNAAEEPAEGTAADPPHSGEAALVEGEDDYLLRHRFRLLKAAMSPGPEVLDLQSGRSLEEGSIEVLARNSKGALAGRVRLGEGSIVVIPDSYAFSNQRLRESPGNMAWLARRVADTPPGRLLVDEYHHYLSRGRGLPELLAAFAATPWGWAVSTLALAGLVYLLGTRRRFGPRLEVADRAPRSPVSLVRARAGLLRSAGAGRLAIQLIERYRQRRPQGGPKAPPRADPQLERYRELLERAERSPRLPDRAVLVLGRMAGELTRKYR